MRPNQQRIPGRPGAGKTRQPHAELRSLARPGVVGRAGRTTAPPPLPLQPRGAVEVLHDVKIVGRWR